MKHTKRFATRLLVIAASVAVTSSYGDQGIKVYSVPKDPKKAAAANPHAVDPHAGLDLKAQPGESQEAPLHWETPSTWKEIAPTSMRVGNFLITKGDKEAQVSIIPLAGKSGSELDNINRWRGEIGLEAVAEAKGESVSVGGAPAKVYDLMGAGEETFAAIQMRGDTSWFFKMRGDKTVIAENKATFLEFLKSIHFHDADASAHAATAPQPLPIPAKETADEKDVGTPKWDLPASWKEKPASAMVLKSFSSGEGANEAKVAISVFPGDVGGPLANVNRWRGQLSLKPVTEAELPSVTKTLEVIGGKATTVEFAGTDARSGQPGKLVAAFVSNAGQTWFYKLTGSEAAVAREKEAFLKFVQTVRY